MSVPSAGSGPNRRPLHTQERSCRNDEGVGQALEAMLIGALVLGAIGFTIASQAPPPPSQAGSSEDLEEKAWDAMQALDKMHYPDEAYGNSLLSYLIAEAAAGNSEPLKESFGEFMPPGSAFTLYIHNGYDRFPLHVNKSAEGHAVGVSYPVEPNWRHHYGATDLRLYNTNVSNIAMGHNLIPIFNANHVHDQGDTVQAAVAGEQSWMPGFLGEDMDSSFRETSYTTFVQGDNDADSYPSANIHMLCGPRAGGMEPCFATDLTAENAVDSEYSPKWKGLSTEDGEETMHAQIGFAVENDGPGALDEGTMLEIHVPVGLPVQAPNETILETLGLENEGLVWSPDGTFENATVEGNDPQPQTVTATLADPLGANETAHLDVWVAVDDDRYAFKKIHATLAEHAASGSQFLAAVDDKEEGTYTGGDTRVVLVSGPNPAGSGPTPDGRWGLVLLNPRGASTIHEATLTLTEDQGHFKNASFPDDFNPPMGNGDLVSDNLEVSDDGTTITWDPPNDHTIEGYSFLELQFDVETHGLSEAVPASPSFPLAEPITQFTGYHPPPHAIQIEPGIWWQEHPPASSHLPGYNVSMSEPPEGDRVVGEAANTLHHRNTDIEGETPFNVANYLVDEVGVPRPEGALRDAVQSASMEPTPQKAAPGESVHVRVDSRDLALYLSKAFGLNELSMESHVYAPWGLMDRIPARTYEHGLSASLSHDPIQMIPADLTGDGEDLVVASSDGNVYGTSGETGTLLAGYTFPVETEDGDSGSPTVLTQSGTAGSPVYGVGTASGLDRWFSLDEDLQKRWETEKPGDGDERFVRTVAIDAGLDITEDGLPEFITGFSISLDEEQDPTGHTRLGLYDGASGDLMTGWDVGESGNGVVINGTPGQVGFANLGTHARSGIWADTGTSYGTNLQENLDDTVEDPVESIEDIGAWAEDTVVNVSASPPHSGFEGYYEDGSLAWKLRGALKHVQRADQMALGSSEDGDPYHGLVATTGSGWLMGLNASKPVNSLMGFEVLAPSTVGDASFSNPMEGYWTTGENIIYATRDAGTSSRAIAVEDTEFNAVSTPVSPTYSGLGKVSWWVGDNGAVYHNDDRFASPVEEVLGVPVMVDTIDTEDPTLGDLLDTSTLEQAHIDFQDVYAVSSEEAWLVGTGVAGTDLEDNGFVLHTQDQGSTFDAYELPCEAVCGIQGIDHDEERLWIVGESGTVFVEDTTTDAHKITAEASDGINETGVLDLRFNVAGGEVSIEKMAVDFTFDDGTKEDWMRGIAIGSGGDLWHKEGGGSHHEGSLADYQKNKGITAATVLNVSSYTDEEGDPSDRVLNGLEHLRVGPFHADSSLVLEPNTYYNRSDYDEENLLPFNVTVTIKYDDGTTSLVDVTVDEDGEATVEDRSLVTWTTPSKLGSALGFTAPETCFGEPDATCATYMSVNATHSPQGDLAVGVVGTLLEELDDPPQSPLTRLSPSEDAFVRVWDDRINQTLEDVAINPRNPEQWIVVGAGPMAARSQTEAHDWSVLPMSRNLDEPLHTVDYTNPNIPFVGGGAGTALTLWAGGHHETGGVETVDLWDAGEGQVDQVEFNESDFRIHLQENGHSNVEIDLYEPAADAWVTVFDPGLGWMRTNDTAHDGNYSFLEPTDEIKLRFNFSTTPGFSPLSAQLYGTLDVIPSYEGAEKATKPVVDLFETAQLDTDTMWNLEHKPQYGYMRLAPAENPWVWRLGNYEAPSEWSENDDIGNGAEPIAMDLGPDGEYVFVATAGIHDGFLGDDTEYTGAYDNSVYKIDVNTGLPDEEWRNIATGDDIIRDMAVGTEYVYVATTPSLTSETVTVTRYEIDTGLTGFSEDTATFKTSLDKLQMVTYEGAMDLTQPDDLATILKPSDLEDAYLRGYEAPALTLEWEGNPSVEGTFEVTYEVPRNALFGAHVVVTEIRWEIPGSEDLVQTARIHNSFDVTPPTKQISLSPTYNLEALVWMEDW